MLRLVKESVLQKTIDGMREEGCPYVGEWGGDPIGEERVRDWTP